MKNGSRKYHVAHEHETRWKTDKKGNNKSCNMGLERNESEIQDFLVQDIIIGEKKHENIQDRIGATTNSISKGL
jgi:hypothetical protein